MIDTVHDTEAEIKWAIYVTCYEKRDHLGFFMKIEFLDSSVCVEHNV